MFSVSDKQFEELINQSLDELPQKYISKLNNIAIITKVRPSEEQRQRLHLHNNQTLYGLYEGIPLTQRGAGYNLVIPDVITIFKEPIESSVYTITELKEQIKHTLWHEIAHFFGLGHSRIHKLDGTQ